MAVDLEVVRAALEDHHVVGVSEAHVIQGDQDPEPPQALEDVAEALHVPRRSMLHDLDDEPPGREAARLEGGREVLDEPRIHGQGGSVDVDPQRDVGRQALGGIQDGLDARAIDSGLPALLAGVLEEDRRVLGAGPPRPSDQGLEVVGLRPRAVHLQHRLEEDREAAGLEDAVEEEALSHPSPP